MTNRNFERRKKKKKKDGDEFVRGEGRKSSKREQRMPRWRRHSARTLAPGSNLERQATNTRPFALNYDCDLSRSIIDPSRQLSLSGCTDQHKESTTQHFTSRNVANHRVFKSEVAANFDLRERNVFFTVDECQWLTLMNSTKKNKQLSFILSPANLSALCFCEPTVLE